MGDDKIGSKKLTRFIIDLNTSSLILSVIIYIGYPKSVMGLGYIHIITIHDTIISHRPEYSSYEGYNILTFVNNLKTIIAGIYTASDLHERAYK